MQGKLRPGSGCRGPRQEYHASLGVTAGLGNKFIGAVQRKLRQGNTMTGAKAKAPRRSRHHSETGQHINRTWAREIRAGGPYAVGDTEKLTQIDARLGYTFIGAMKGKLRQGDHLQWARAKVSRQVEASQRDWATNVQEPCKGNSGRVTACRRRRRKSHASQGVTARLGYEIHRDRAREIKAGGPYAVGEGESLTQVEASQRHCNEG